ncbi:MAG: heavy metal-associated domain-containing protein [Dehalococcoidia bacterium]
MRFHSLLRLLRVHPSRLASAPRLRVLGSAVADVTSSEGATQHLAVDGLVCAVCAARTAHALRAVPGVRAVRVDLDRGTAEVEVDTPVSPAALKAALASVVVAPGARRAMERAVTRWRTRGLPAPREGRAWLR